MMPADEVRRRGNHRRTTRRASIAAGTAALALVAGFAVWQSPLADGFRTPQWANTAVPSPTPTDSPSPSPSPTTSSSPTPTSSSTPDTNPSPTSSSKPSTTQQPNLPPAPVAPTVDNLPTSDMLDQPGADPLTAVDQDEIPPDTPAELDVCNTGDYGLPDTFLSRWFTYGDPTDLIHVPAASVLGYASADQAKEGFDEIRDAAAGCGTRLEELGWSDPRINDVTSEVPFYPVWAGTDDTEMAYFTMMALPQDPDNEAGFFVDTVVVRAGERVLWVSHSFEGWDNECSLVPDSDIDQCPMSAGLQDMVEHLVK